MRVLDRRVSALLVAAALVGCEGEDRSAPKPSNTAQRAPITRLDTAPRPELRLTRHVPPRVVAACDEARRRVEIAVVCPALVPDSRLVGDPDLHEVSTYGAPPRMYELSFNHGQNPGALHWSAGAGEGVMVERELLSDRYNEVKGKPHLLRRLLVGGQAVLVYRFPPHPAGGPNGGHLMAIAPVGRFAAFASPHGYGNANVAVVMALDLARRLRAQTPPTREE